MSSSTPLRSATASAPSPASGTVRGTGARVRNSPVGRRAAAGSGVEPVFRLSAAEQQRLLNRRKIQQQLVNLDLNDGVRDIAQGEYDDYRQLQEFERNVEAATDRSSAMLKDAHSNFMQTTRLYNMSRRKLRVHIFNTYENQPYHNYELDTLQPKDHTTTGPPSWTLHLRGSVLQKDKCPSAKFTSFFDRILVITNKETILWDKRHPSFAECDGLEIKREGSFEHEIKILFFLEHKTPVFSLASPLSTFVGKEHSTLPGIVRAVWEHVVTYDLQSVEDPFWLRCDDTLKQLLSEPATEGHEIESASRASIETRGDATIWKPVEGFRLNDLPRLLKRFLMPPKPVVLVHQLRLSGDWIQTEATYDFTVEAVDVHPVDLNDAWLPDPRIINDPQHNDTMSVLQGQIDEVDRNIVKVLDRIQTRLGNRNCFRCLASNPARFIQSQLHASRPDPSKVFVDPAAMYEYEMMDSRASYFKQPWVPRAISRLLSSQNSSFEDQVCKVLAAYNIPDPRKASQEEYAVTSSRRRPATKRRRKLDEME
eukprot:GHVT01001321.1.p1 GENE.GHVT01001321.1~~GHVT01001321.1.p1  ORF type:complete len:538 (-),score=46.83 GHVT01001321.1:1712-3325(-)